MTNDLKTVTWRLSKAAPSELNKSQAEQIVAYVSKQRAKWEEQLSKAPKDHKVLFIEDPAIDQKCIICPSARGDGVDCFIVLSNIYEPAKEKGAYKLIYKAAHFSTGKLVALMVSDLNTKKGQQYGMREAKLLKDWKGTEGLVQTYRIIPFIQEGKYLLIIQHYYPLGNLREATIAKILSEKDQYQIAYDLMKTFSRIHEKGWMVFDVRPENVLLQKVKVKGKEKIQATLCDLAKMFQLSNDFLSKIKIYNRWDPPEVHYYFCLGGKGKEHIGPASDIFSLGVHLKKMFFGSLPSWTQIKGKRRKYIAMRDLSKNPEPSNKNSLEYLLWEMQHPVPTKRVELKEAILRLTKIAKMKQINIF